MKKNRYFLMLLFFVMLAGFVGCAKDTREAKIEDAQIAIDNKDFSQAIAILRDGSFDFKNDPEAASLLASAHMGRAGLDVIKMVDEASQAATSGATGTFTEFSKLFSSDPGVLKERQNDTKAAVDLLSGLPANKTPAQNLQLAVVASADIIITIGAELTRGFKSDGRPNSIPLSTDITKEIVDRVANDVGFMADGVAGSGIADQELTKDITTIKTELADPSGKVTSTSLLNYLNKI